MKKILFLLAAVTLTALQGLDYSKYGAGPMVKPNRTFYVSPKGNDKNDGRTLEKAFRSLHKAVSVLRAGDTLLLDEGTYYQHEVPINVKEDTVGHDLQCGKPGSPIRIMGMKGKKAVLVGGLQMKPAKQQGQIAEFAKSLEAKYNMVQELPSGIELQRVGSEETVREIPGTFYRDPKTKKLIVHYAALDQTGVSVARHRVGIRIHGSYIHLENLEFRHFYEGIYARMNRPYEKNKASNITIQNCRFFYNYKSGFVLDGATWTLLKNNQGAFNTMRGHFMHLAKATDNLYLGNWCGSTANTLRQKRLNSINYGINSYGSTPPRNHIIGNCIESTYAFRWKGGNPDSILRDNEFRGVWHAESRPVPATITNNLFLNRFSWPGICGYRGWEKDFKNTPIKFYGNFKDEKEFKNNNPDLVKARSLKVVFPEPKFPKAVFKDLKICYIGKDSAAVTWQMPDCDGWGDVTVNKKGERKKRNFTSGQQGSKHAVGITELQPGTEYEVTASFRNRRGGRKVYSQKLTFKTAAADRAPRVLEVGPGKLTLAEASLAAMPGDTVKLLPGTHHGQFIPLRNGTAEKPITLTGKDAVIDALGFYSPAVRLHDRHHIVIDGVTFANPDVTTSANVIVTRLGSHITIKNCKIYNLDWNAGDFIHISHTPHTVIKNNLIHGGAYPISVSGKKVKILNNTIVDAVMLTLNLWTVDELEIRNNIFYRPCIPAKRNPSILLTDAGKNIISDGNVFWSPLKEHPIGGRIRDAKIKVTVNAKTLKEWQDMTGMDKNSIHADPLFVNYSKGDFRLKPGSPAKGKGAYL